VSLVVRRFDRRNDIRLLHLDCLHADPAAQRIVSVATSMSRK